MVSEGWSVDWSIDRRVCNQSCSWKNTTDTLQCGGHSPLNNDSVQCDGQAANLQSSDKNTIYKTEIMYLRTGSSALTQCVIVAVLGFILQQNLHATGVFTSSMPSRLHFPMHFKQQLITIFIFYCKQLKRWVTPFH